MPDQPFETLPVAGREDDHVGRDAGPVGQHHLVPVESLESRDRFDGAAADRVDDADVLDGDRAITHDPRQQPRVRSRQPVRRQVRCRRSPHERRDPVRDRQRKPADEDAAVLRDPGPGVAPLDVRDGPDREQDAPGPVLAQVDGDLRAGVPRPDDQDVLAGELRPGAVLTGRDHPAAVAVQSRNLRRPRSVVEPCRDDHIGGGEHLTIGHRQRPAAAARAVVDPLHRATEPDLEAVVSGIRLEVAHEVIARDPAPHLLGDRQAGQAGEVPRRVQVQPVVVRAPRAADPVRAVEDDGPQTAPSDLGGHREPGRAGSDDEGVDAGTWIGHDHNLREPTPPGVALRLRPG